MGGGRTTTRGGANHKMSGSEVMHNSDSNYSTFQEETCLRGCHLKIFSCICIDYLQSTAEATF